MSNILRIPPRRPPLTTSKMDLDVPQITTINQVGAPSSEPDFEEEYVTEDEEIDEIIDDEPLPTAHKANGKGKAKATPNNLTPGATPVPGEQALAKQKLEKLVPPLPPRKAGETHVDQQRVEKIIKAHGDMLPPSKDAVFLISLAAEEFIKRLAEIGRRYALEDERDSIDQGDMARAAQTNRSFFFLRETLPTAIPLSLALQKHAQKDNERTLIATELTHPSSSFGNGTSGPSHKKRQPPLPKGQTGAKGKTRTSARQANGRSSSANVSPASTSASASASGLPAASSPRPKRAAAQKGRGSWKQADDDSMDYEDEEQNPAPPMEVDDPVMQWRLAPHQGAGSPSAGRGGIMKGFGPGAYGKVGALAGRAGSGSPPHTRNTWGFPQEPPHNTGRTIYSGRTDEEARKAVVEAEEQLRYKRAWQEFELMTQGADEEYRKADAEVEERIRHKRARQEIEDE